MGIKMKITSFEIEDIMYDEIDARKDDLFGGSDIIIRSCHLGEDVIYAHGKAWRVVDKNLIFIEGVYCNYNPETGELCPDWGLTLIYENVSNEQFDPSHYLYFEQDPPETAIHNYLNTIGENK